MFLSNLSFVFAKALPSGSAFEPNTEPWRDTRNKLSLFDEMTAVTATVGFSKVPLGTRRKNTRMALVNSKGSTPALYRYRRLAVSHLKTSMTFIAAVNPKSLTWHEIQLIP